MDLRKKQKTERHIKILKTKFHSSLHNLNDSADKHTSRYLKLDNSHHHAELHLPNNYKN